MMIFVLIALLLLALLGLFTPLRRAEEGAIVLTGVAFLVSISGFFLPHAGEAAYGLRQGSEAFLFSAVISFISLVIQAYALRNFGGSRFRRRNFRYFLSLTLSLLLFALSDQLLLMVLSLGVSNFLLSRLIAHQPEWEAARTSGRMAWRQLGLATLMLLGAAGIVYAQQGSWSLQALEATWTDRLWLALAGGLVVAAALAQSAIWPLHRWLIASANAPTPVSAFMHAGLVNGGGVILYKFAPLLRQIEGSATVLVLMGALSAILGTVWMLVQSDVKRTLTCSTMGQMGFMIMQCGLGLFPAAIAHMIWHGFFKASLFLSAGSTVKAAKNQRLQLEGPYALPIFAFGLLTGLAGTWIFWRFTGQGASLESTYLLLLFFCGITCAHAVMNILHTRPSLGRALLAAVLGLLGATIYGASVAVVESQLTPLTALPLNGLSIGLLVFFLAGWVLMIFRPYLPGSLRSRFLAPLYVRMLRDSQPASRTLSLRRGQYRI